MANAPRRRRTPEQARAEILDAATELIARRGPDGASLRQVAEAAGVTHGLVTHYFGTYRGLVGAVLRGASERRQARIRERMRADGGIPHADRVFDELFRTLADEQYVRLWAWSMLNPEGDQNPSEGLAAFVDAFEHGVGLALSGVDRARIEQVVLLGLSASYGYALGRRGWLTGLGHDPDAPHWDNNFADTLAKVSAAYLDGRT
ncbi:MAG TPA: TetR/AcrR family transcriptional regulator [Pseudonocardiaceae bacterium]|nr:TetR/AcrR family transcriptional regulator [Pseudonocardiaceae bacterium]